MADPDNREDLKWSVAEAAQAAGFAALAIFLVTLFAPAEWSTRFSNAGQALGAIAGAAAIVAVLYTAHQLELQRRALKEQEESTRAEHKMRSQEELRRAYAQLLSDLDSLMNNAEGLLTASKPLPKLVSDTLDRIRSIAAQRWVVRLLETSERRYKQVETLATLVAALAPLAVDAAMDAPNKPAKAAGIREHAAQLRAHMDILIAHIRAELTISEEEPRSPSDSEIAQDQLRRGCSCCSSGAHP